MRYYKKRNLCLSKKRIKVIRIKIKLVIISVLFIIIAMYIESFLCTSVKNIVSVKANVIGSEVINQGIINVYKSSDMQNMINVTYTNNNTVSSIIVNQEQLNLTNQEIIQSINQQLKAIPSENIYLSVGSLTGIAWLNGKGAKIKISMQPVGYIKTKISSDFMGMGINQTKHSIYIDIEIEVMCMMFFYRNSTKVTNQVILAESIIVGNVPTLHSGTLLQSTQPVLP